MPDTPFIITWGKGTWHQRDRQSLREGKREATFLKTVKSPWACKEAGVWGSSEGEGCSLLWLDMLFSSRVIPTPFV